MTALTWPQELAIRSALALTVVAFLLGLFSVMTYIERRLLAFMQFRLGPNRTGPLGLFQPVADGIKLFFKEEFVPQAANRWAFIAAPAVAITTALMAVAVIPYGGAVTMPRFDLLPEWLRGRPIPLQIAHLDVGVLYLFAVSTLGVYGIVLAGWSANNKWSLIGALRSSAQMFSYELALGLSWVGPILLAESLRIEDIVACQAGGIHRWNAIIQLPAFMIYLFAATAEVGRLPFDLPEAEAELVAGFHTEYASMKFALLQMAEYVNMITVSVLATDFFLGGWHAPLVSLQSAAGVNLGLLWFGGKTGALLFLFIWLRGTLPRLRYDQLMRFGWKVLVPAAVMHILGTAAVILWLTR
ncbi:MAG: NADH-quinone oxidoreductase subunit NuoH [Vicinamibacteria bacterium]|nr:NADH-quinone oxidoreductase subunit NuoH [Vicinamibacteria bacterium]